MGRLCPSCQSSAVPGELKRGRDNRLWVSKRVSNGSYRWLRQPTKKRKQQITKSRASYFIQMNTGERSIVHVAGRRQHQQFCNFLKFHNVNIVSYANDPDSRNIIMSVLAKCNQRRLPQRGGTKRATADNPVVRGDRKLQKIK